MKAKLVFKAIWKFILRHYVWLIPAVCTAVFVIFPHKPVGPLLSGMASIGFLWSMIHLFNHYFKAPKEGNASAEK
jgi:hypothetical protein